MAAELDLHDVAFDHPKAMRELLELQDAARVAEAVERIEAWRRGGERRSVSMCTLHPPQLVLEVNEEHPVYVGLEHDIRDAILAAGDWLAAGEGV